MKMRHWRSCAIAASVMLTAAGSWAQVSAPAATTRPGMDPSFDVDAFPSVYKPAPSEPTAIINATLLTAAGPRIDRGVLLIRDGKIAAVGRDVAVPAGIRVIDAKGRYVTPGIVDPHSHIGVGSSPGEANGDSSNESGPNAAGIWVEHAVWPQDPMFERALAAGVTTAMILPGSANLFNGRTVTLKMAPALSPQAMKYPGAPYGLKIACGENPTGGGPGKPGTRAGGMLGYRTTFLAASAYAEQVRDYRRKIQAGQAAQPPRRDLALETVAAALDGKVKVHIHCYRADEMLQMIDLSREFGFKIAAFHHALEAFKIAPVLAREGIAVATWAGDWSGYKMEAYDSIMENAAFVEAAGGIAAMHSDNVMIMQYLNHEAGRAMTAGREAGLNVTQEQAIRWLTLNPAKIIGLEAKTGSLETGKDADVVIWSADPFSIYSQPDLVLVDGAVMHDRSNLPAQPRSDFELGLQKRPPQTRAGEVLQ